MDESPAPAPDTAPATSAPPDAAPAPTPTDRLAQMSPVERAAWRKDGTVPGVTGPGVETPVVSAQGDGDPGGDPGEDHSQAPEAAAPAPDPAASAAGRALQKRKQTAQERINDLAREKYRLEGELKALRETQASRQDLSRPAAAAETPAPAPTASPASGDGLAEPQEEDFATYKDFVKATARYEHRLAQAEAESRAAQTAQQQAYAAAAAAHDTRVRAFITTHPDYLDVIQSQTAVYPTPLLAAAVLHSALAPELAYHLNTHVDEYQALVALPPGPQLQALGKLEARLEAAAGSPAGVASSPNHVTRAPAPPVTLGSRPAEPADDVERAGARRDVGAYLRAANARELALRRSGS